MMLVILGQIFTATYYIAEELILANYTIDPLLICGVEGIWGTLVYQLFLIFAQNIHCGDWGKGSICSFGYLENSAYAFEQLKLKPVLILLIILIAVSVAAYKAFSVGVTKYSSATARSTIRTSTSVVVWIISASLGLQKW